MANGTAIIGTVAHYAAVYIPQKGLVKSTIARALIKIVPISVAKLWGYCLKNLNYKQEKKLQSKVGKIDHTKVISKEVKVFKCYQVSSLAVKSPKRELYMSIENEIEIKCIKY